MKFLLDTHFLYWIPIGDPRMGREAEALLEDSEHQFLFSAVSLLEIALKRSKRGPGFGFDPRAIRRAMLEHGFQEVALTGSHALAVDLLPTIHADPFDRMLLAQAMVEEVTLLTRDQILGQYPGPIRKV